MTESVPSVRVVELSTPLTRFAGRLLVGLGYEVVLVEPPAGDATRTELDGYAFAHWHAGKRSVVLDPTDTAYRDDVARLLDGADIVLDGHGVQSAGPATVHVGVTPFGPDGPRRDWAGPDLVLTALGGIMAQVGAPDDPPLTLPQGQAEQLTGATAAIAAVLGLQARRRTGRGQRVDVSALECVAASLETGILVYLHEDRVAPRPGRVHPLVPHGLFRAADGYLGGGLGGSPRMWDALLEWLVAEGAQADLDEPRFGAATERKRQQEHVFEVVQEFCGAYAGAEFADLAQARKLPWASVDGPRRLLNNPQLRHRDFFVDVATAQGTVRDLGFGFAFDSRPPGPLPVPGLGADQRLLEQRRNPVPPAAARTSRSTGGGALDGVRVLDLTWVLAGPYCTHVLADHGAEVIKIESAGRPDPTRFAPFMHLSRGPHEDPNTSGYFNNFNRNKRSIRLNLRSEEGIGVLRDLIATSDVVVENFSATVMRRLGLDYDRLREIRADIIYVSMSGMGHTGPRSDWVSYADTVSASSGLTGLTGWAPDDIVGVIYGHGDIVAGLQAAFATVAALERRADTGEGQHIDLSQLEAMAAHMGTSVLEWTALGRESVPVGNAHPQWVPHGVYPCLGVDRWCAVAVRSDAEWVRLASVLGRPELAEDERTSTARRRRANAEFVDSVITAWTRATPATAVAESLQAHGVPAGVVQDGRELVENDPQLRARDFFVQAEHPAAGSFLHEGLTAHLAATPGGIARPAPLLGADTECVLHDILGMSDARIAELHAANVLS